MTEEKEHSTDPRIAAIRRHPLVKLAIVLLPAIATSIAAYTGAAGDARNEAAVVKDKAESGYQATKEALTELHERVAQLSADMAALKRAVRAGSKRVAPSVKVVVTPPAQASPPPLPPDLDKALQVQQAKQPEAPKQ